MSKAGLMHIGFHELGFSGNTKTLILMNRRFHIVQMTTALHAPGLYFYFQFVMQGVMIPNSEGGSDRRYLQRKERVRHCPVNDGRSYAAMHKGGIAVPSFVAGDPALHEPRLQNSKQQSQSEWMRLTADNAILMQGSTVFREKQTGHSYKHTLITKIAKKFLLFLRALQIRSATALLFGLKCACYRSSLDAQGISLRQKIRHLLPGRADNAGEGLPRNPHFLRGLGVLQSLSIGQS